MQDRRLVGIDLGITSAHTVRVLAGDGGLVCRRKAVPTVESLGEVEQAALAGAAAGTRLEVVVEPTGPAWLPIAVFFATRGHTVYRVSSAKAHDLRRFLRRHAKSNGIDADTLARLPLVDPAGLHPLQLPDAARAALDRRVRACDRLTRQAADHKRRIKGLVRQLLPASPLTGELGQADLAVLERWADPQALVAVGSARLQQVLASASAGQQGTQRAEQWLAAAHAALELYGDHSAIAWQGSGRRGHQRGPAAARHPGRAGRPRQGAGSLLPAGRPGRAGPQPARPGRDRRARPGRHHGQGQPLRHRGQVPLLHRPGPTSIRDRPDRPQRPTHHQGRQPAAADHPGPRRRPRPPTRPPARPHLLDPDGRARQRPPGGGLCGRRHLAERAWTVMDRGTPYVICDTDATPVTPAQAKQIIAERWTVPEEVRRRRRSKKGKAPQQVLQGHVHGAQGATRRPSPSSATLGQPPSRVKPTQPQP